MDQSSVQETRIHSTNMEAFQTPSNTIMELPQNQPPSNPGPINGMRNCFFGNTRTKTSQTAQLPTNETELHASNEEASLTLVKTTPTPSQNQATSTQGGSTGLFHCTLEIPHTKTTRSAQPSCKLLEFPNEILDLIIGHLDPLESTCFGVVHERFYKRHVLQYGRATIHLKYGGLMCQRLPRDRNQTWSFGPDHYVWRAKPHHFL